MKIYLKETSIAKLVLFLNNIQKLNLSCCCGLVKPSWSLFWSSRPRCCVLLCYWQIFPSSLCNKWQSFLQVYWECPRTSSVGGGIFHCLLQHYGCCAVLCGKGLRNGLWAVASPRWTRPELIFSTAAELAFLVGTFFSPSLVNLS